MKRWMVLFTLAASLMGMPAFSLAQTATPTASPTGTSTPVNGLCKRVLAYYTSWTSGSYSASMVPYTKLTHICYAFVTPNSNGSVNGTSGGLYSGGALNGDCTSLVANAHSHGVKVLVSCGGAGVPGSTFSALMASGTAVTAFVNNLYGMAVTNNFDGVDIDWEYPSSNADKANFVAFMQALRAKFDGSPMPAPNWLITAAVSPGYLTQYLDLANLKNSMSFFNVMTYDYHGSWTSHSGHVGGLFQATGDVGHAGANGMSAVTYYTGQGVPASQINYGLAFYGYGFDTGSLFGSCACNTNTLTYSQIVPLIGAGWTRYWDNSAVTPYLLPTGGGASIICYDDPPSVLAKSNYVLNSANVGGVFMWALNQDYLGPGNQPLLDSMAQMAALCGSPTPTPFPTYTPVPTPTPIVAATWRVNSGGSSYMDTQSNSWLADTQFLGGSGASVGNAIANTTDPTLYQSERWGSFTYTFNVPAGSYQVTLKFAEIYWTTAGKRQFNVSINGTPVLTNFDIVADAGGAFRADDKVFNSIAPNGSGQIVIQFSPGSQDMPKVSALQVIPQPATPTPTATATSTFTPTSTDTPCMVAGTPCTSSPTPTVTATPTLTPTPASGFKPLVYPNPLKGPGPVTLQLQLTKASNVSVKIFSTAFRKIREEDFSQVAAGTSNVIIDLHDKVGQDLADGFYYLVVDSGDGHTVLKFLCLR